MNEVLWKQVVAGILSLPDGNSLDDALLHKLEVAAVQAPFCL